MGKKKGEWRTWTKEMVESSGITVSQGGLCWGWVGFKKGQLDMRKKDNIRKETRRELEEKTEHETTGLQDEREAESDKKRIKKECRTKKQCFWGLYKRRRKQK